MILTLLAATTSLALAGDGGTPNPIVQLQLWGTAYDQDVDPQADAATIGDPEDDPGLKIKRARVGFGDHQGKVAYRAVVGFTAPYDGVEREGDGEIELLDAIIGYQVARNFALQAGESKLPFSRDSLMSATDLTFEERGFGAEYIGEDHVLGFSGIAMGGGFKGQAGVYNSGGDLFGDNNAGKTFAGRAEYRFGERDDYALWGGPGKGKTLGVGASGFVENDVSTRTAAAGADALVRVRGLSVLVDGAYAMISPTNTDISVPGVLSDTTRVALTGQLSYSVGDFEPAVRYTSMMDSGLGDYSQILAGVVWHTAINEFNYDRLRVGAGYVHRAEPEVLSNDTIRLWTQLRI